jgi:peptide/nickel transport system permease protein
MSDAIMPAPVPSGQAKAKSKAKQRPGGAMARFVAVRIAGLAVTLFIASLVVFGALYAAPGNPLTYLTHGRTMSPEAIAAIKAEYHLDDSIWQQYLRWLGGVLHGDFGTSIIYNQPVSSLVGSRASVTTLLVLMAAAIVLVLGLAIGTLAGLRPGWVSRSAMAAATGVMAVPTFVGAVVLIVVFAVQLEWFPVFGAGRAGLDEVYHLVLPSLALALASVAFVARLAQTAVRQAWSADHVRGG